MQDTIFIWSSARGARRIIKEISCKEACHHVSDTKGPSGSMTIFGGVGVSFCVNDANVSFFLCSSYFVCVN